MRWRKPCKSLPRSVVTRTAALTTTSRETHWRRWGRAMDRPATPRPSESDLNWWAELAGVPEPKSAEVRSLALGLAVAEIRLLRSAHDALVAALTEAREHNRRYGTHWTGGMRERFDVVLSLAGEEPAPLSSVERDGLTANAAVAKSLRRTRRPMSAKAQAYDREFRKASEEVKARSAGRCEARIENSSVLCLVWGYEVHHKRRRSQGGTNDLNNLIYACIPCHRWIHEHPADAAALGLLTMGKSGR